MLNRNILLLACIPIASVAVLAVMFASDVNTSVVVDEPLSEKKGKGLQPFGVYQFNQTTLVNVDPMTDGKMSDRYEKYGDIRHSIPVLLNYKILMLDKTTKDSVTILLSPYEMSREMESLNFIYHDEGIAIRVTTLSDPVNKGKDYWDTRLNTGYRHVDITSEYRGVIQSMHSVEQYGETVDVKMKLNFHTDTHSVSVRGFISDELAIDIAQYIIKKES